MAATTILELDTATAVLDFARDRRAAADRAEADLLVAAAQWAAIHPPECIEYAATFGDTEICVAGPGAPLVAEFSIHEFAAAIGLPTEVGKAYVGEAVELCHRLPRVWRKVVAGQVQAWRARRIARHTIPLTQEAAAWVDQQVSPFADKIGPVSTDRLIETAIGRFMPEEAAAKALAAAERRCFDLHTEHVESLDGTIEFSGRIDVGDACDVQEAITQIAHSLKTAGSTESLDVRRSMALGELARRQLAFDFHPESGTTGRQVTLHVHVREGDPVAHLDEQPVMLEQVKAWCRDGTVTIKPVIDLTKRLETDAYTPTDAIRDHVILRDPVCVFPYCTKKSRDCDLDHVKPFKRGKKRKRRKCGKSVAGGRTATDNLAPLCRRHHRVKTHGAWRYRMLTPGTYQWTSPHGHRFIKHRTETSRPPDE